LELSKENYESQKNIGRREFIENGIFGVLSGRVYLSPLNRTTVIKGFSGKDESNKKNKEEKIDYRKLGNIGYNASVVGLGAMLTNDASVLQRALDMGLILRVVIKEETMKLWWAGNQKKTKGHILNYKK